MKKKYLLASFVVLIKLHFINAVFAQSLEHPIIWVTESERKEMLKKIDNYDWAESVVDQLHDRVDKKNETHKTSPNII